MQGKQGVGAASKGGGGGRREGVEGMQRRGQRLEGRRRGEKGTGGGAPRRAKTSGVCWGVEGLAFQLEWTGKGMQKGGGGIVLGGGSHRASFASRHSAARDRGNGDTFQD